MKLAESVKIEKIPGGFRVDGLELKKGKCGCTSIAKCCYSYSKVKKKGNVIEFEAKLTAPDTKDNFNWSYVVKKADVVVKVKVEDARDKEIYSGYMPPAVQEWIERGWEVVEKEGDREDGTLWRCAVCKWLYKEDLHGRVFEELPEDWRCPQCNAPKKDFERI